MITKDILINEIPTIWKQFIGSDEFDKRYWDNIVSELNKCDFYPSLTDIFNSFKLINPNDVKVVILGQDPYIKPNQAIGISFGVKNGLNIPPSLRNIYNEIINEYNLDVDIKEYSKKGDLSILSSNGVLLLNNILTVKSNKSLSHKNIGWEYLTSKIINLLDKNNKMVFIGFGNYANNVLINNVKFNSKLLYGHPSPLNTTNRFLGCNCFKECNDVLIKNNIEPINWSIVFNQ